MAQGTAVTCETREVQIALFVEGDLEPAERDALSAHLTACPRCRTFAEELTQSQAALKSLGDAELDPGALADVRYRVREALDHPRPSAARWWALTAAAAVAIVALFAVRRSPDVLPPVDPMVEETPTEAPTATATAIASAAPRPAPSSMALDAMPSAPRPSTRRATSSPSVRQRPTISVERLPMAPDGVSPEGVPPAVVKIKTSDPDVVIYWVEDSTGGQS